MLILERPWTRQPQTVVGVDYSHPSAKGLVFAWNGATRRNATKQPGLHSSYGSGLTDHYANNTGFNPNGTGSLSFTGTHTCTSNEITVLYVFRYLTTAQFTQWKVQYGIPYGSVLSVGVYLSGANILSDAAAINLGDNLSLNSLFVVYPGSGSTSAFHLNNNNDVVVTSSATLTGLTPTIRLCANLNDPSAGISSNSAGYLVLIWNRALGRQERLQILQHPWQLFQPHRIYVPTAIAGGVPTLSASTYVPGSLSSTGWRPQVTAS